MPGLSLVEAVISTAILSVIMGVLFLVTQTTGNLARTGQSEVDVEEMARRALQRITDDLQQAGRVTLSGKQYPRFGNFSNTPSALYTAAPPSYPTSQQHRKYCPVPGVTDPNPGCGVPTGYSSNFAHPGITHHYSTDPNFTEVSREVIFVMPTVNMPPASWLPNQPGPPYANGQILWAYTNSAGVFQYPEEIAYVVNTGPDGINQLERRTVDGMDGLNGTLTGQSYAIATYIERLVVDDIGGSPDADGSTTVNKTNQVRVTLYFAQPSSTGGSVIQTQLTGVVTMRNQAQD